MMTICEKKILVSRCVEGIYLRWWFNGWHYFNFTNGYEIEMKTEQMDIQVSQFFSVISKIERSTRIKSEYAYRVTLHGIKVDDISGFTGLLLAEKVEQYESGVWREVDITRGDHIIKEEGTNGYILEFEVTRKELPESSSVYQKVLKLYIGDTLCDMDDDEVIPINKQVNNIAEMQDRQSDFTAQFRIRKTRAMKALFEMSGEVGATTEFPYERQECRLIQDNIEIITGGILVLDKVDDEYYYVSIVSGNINFFNLIAGQKITDLTLADCNHTWDADYMEATHLSISPGINVVYPLCEPSDDGSIAPLTDDGDRVEMYGGWIWCFIRLQTIWEEIFANAGFTVIGGDIIGSDIFSKLYIPIASLKITDTSKYLYWSYWVGNKYSPVNSHIGNVDFPGTFLMKGDANFLSGYYYCPFDGIFVLKLQTSYLGVMPDFTVYKHCGMVITNEGNMTGELLGFAFIEWTLEVMAEAGCYLEILQTTNPVTFFGWDWKIAEIKDAKLGYGSYVEPRLYLPDMTQTDFIKMVCNLLGLVPEVIPRDREIRFWNYSELYNNLFIARDWSAYLSERDDEVEFKFGDYGQSNYLKYKESDDVLEDNGKGDMPLEDETLPEEKDIVQLALSTCDEVTILTNIFSVDVSRINFNTWDENAGEYNSNDKIDPRIVYIDYCLEVASPLYQKEFWIRETVLPLAGLFTDHQIITPKIAQSIEISFSNLVFYYASLSRMLTKANVRKAKFNLPVYEVAGLRHNIPIYLSQYKAYFYINKIINYVAGQLCTVELIKL